MKTRLTLALLCFLAPVLAAAGPSDAFDVYAKLMGKTVLMPSTLPFASDAVLSDLSTEKTNAIARLETEFSKQGIAVVQDGPHFVILFPEKQRALITNGLSLRGVELAVTKSHETMPAGVINLVNVDTDMVLPMYASISRRTLLRPGVPPPALIHLKTTCPLTREEALYAIETVLALNGVALME